MPKVIDKKIKKFVEDIEEPLQETPKVELVDTQNPPFDPDIPEQKQRWLR